MSDKIQGEMTFIQHLEVLRFHLMRSAIAVLVFSVLAFVNKRFLFDELIFGPKRADFFTFQKLCQLSEYLNSKIPSLFSDPTLLCIGADFPALQNIDMAGQFTSHIMVSMIAGLVLSFPYLLFEMWRFIKPGLEQNESKYARGIVFWASLLFMSGVLFGYYLIAPLSVNFFFTYSISDQVQTLPTLSTYVSTVTGVVLAAGIVFELPLIVYFLSKVGILSPKILREYRKHFVVVALILSAIITPPDIFSQILVTIPLIVLYEISITISGRVIALNAK
ncbi:MAG: sec-independent protein translocase protein TatC [Salibacteraceae bacterium]|jgi:sec-independent protein translocase protein TatC